MADETTEQSDADIHVPKFDVAVFEREWDHGVGGPTYRVTLDPECCAEPEG